MDSQDPPSSRQQTGLADIENVPGTQPQGARVLMRDTHPTAEASAAAETGLNFELARANEALRQAETRLRQVMDLVPNFIYAQDLDGRFLLANKAVSRAYGRSLESILGKTDAELGIIKREVVAPRQIDPSLTESGPLKLISEEHLLDRNGSLRHLQTVQIPFTLAHAGTPSMLCVSTDITEVRRSEERLRLLMEGTASSVGAAFFQSLVKHLASALGMEYAVIGELRDTCVHTLAFWANGALAENVQYELADTPCEQVTRDGKLCFFPSAVTELFPRDLMLREMGVSSYLGAPLIGSNGEVLGLLAVLGRRDADEANSLRQMFSIFAARAAAELERQAIEEQRRVLQAQMLHVQKLESLGILAGGIAHDFNNLLASILGNAGLAQLYLPSGAAAAPYLEEIEKAAQRSAELVQQMLAYAGKGRFSVQRANLNDIVKEMAGLLRSSVSKSAEFVLELDPQPLWIDADATQLRQVAMNLITNASDALGGEYGRICLRTRVLESLPPSVTPNLGADRDLPGPIAVLEVADTGCGMDEATRARLFDPFYTTKDHGRGLGLSALLGIIRAHRGVVSVESTLGQGSTFSIFLPMAQAPAVDSASSSRAAAAKAPKPPQPATENGAILVADDEAAIRQLAARILERQGFAVHLAADGQQALEIFRAEGGRFAAVLLDMAMPKMGGLEALAEMRRLSPQIKVLLSSGFGEEAAMPQAGSGAVFFLQKPYRPQDLTEKLQALITADPGAD